MRPFLLAAVALALACGTAHMSEAAGPVSRASEKAKPALLPAPPVAEPAASSALSESEFRRAFTDRWGVPCREYVRQLRIGEKSMEASGTVCRAADGSWTLRE
jgi:hypothetical protein